MDELTWSMPVTVDVESLAFSLARDLDYNELINFIRRLDLAVADWDFSKLIIGLSDQLVADAEVEGVKL